MNNKELDDLLKVKFEVMYSPSVLPSVLPSVVPAVMQKVVAFESERLATVVEVRNHDWLLLVALLLGAVVGLPFIQFPDLAPYAQQIYMAFFGQAVEQASTWMVSAVGFVFVGPMLWLLVED